VGSASSVFLAVTALSLVIARTRIAGLPDEDDGNSKFLEYPHDPVTDAELRTRRNIWSAQCSRTSESAGIRWKGATVVAVRSGLSQDNRLAVALTRNDAQHAPRLIPSLSPEPSPVTMPAQPTSRLAEQRERSLWPLSGVFRPTPSMAATRKTGVDREIGGCAGAYPSASSRATC
jgi:hypothetical protein